MGRRYPHHFRQLSKGAPERQLKTERATIEEVCAMDLEEGASTTVCVSHALHGWMTQAPHFL